MKKKYQICLIIGMLLITSVMLVMIFSKQFIVKADDSEQKEIKEVVVTEEPKAEIKEEAKEEIEIEVKEGVEEKIETLSFVTSDRSYFDDALFIGDSRTVGLSEYGDIKNADYFASVGLNIYDLWKEDISVEGVGRVTLKELLNIKKYQKVYIMLGINEIGYNQKKTIGKYEETISSLQEMLPNTIFYLCANLHVTEKRSNKDDIINNKNIDKFNSRLEALTNNQNIFYIDINELFDDESGNLRAECTNDQVHVRAKYYKDWSHWLCENTIQRGNEGNETR